MTEPTVCTWLREHSLAELCTTYAIKANRHGEFPNLVQLKYDQILSPMSEPMVRECRGVILDESGGVGGWKVVAFPYTKFFNHGEGHAAAIDWTSAQVYEKLDGSLMTLYWYEGRWRVASSGMPDGAGPVYGSGSLTFSGLFWRTWEALGYKLPTLGLDYTFMFELMTPQNRIVVPHATPRLVLHGVRFLRGFYEMAPEGFADFFGWECVKSFPLGTIADVIAAAAAIAPASGEGYVVRDGAFNRVKVKSPQYVALAHLKDGMAPRRLLEIVRTNEGSEFLVHFPEWQGAYDAVRARFDALCAEVEMDFDRLRSTPDQKAFALEAVQGRCSGALFALRSGKAATVRAYFAGVTQTAIERLIPLEDLADLCAQVSAPPTITPELPGTAAGGAA